MTDTYQEVQYALDFALATLGGHSNQGDACNALRGAKIVLNRLESAHVAATTPAVEPPVEVPDELKALIAEGAATPAEENPSATDIERATASLPEPAGTAAENVSPAKETLAQRIEHAVEGALGVAVEVA